VIKKIFGKFKNSYYSLGFKKIGRIVQDSVQLNAHTIKKIARLQNVHEPYKCAYSA
jgi:hypothetical protein